MDFQKSECSGMMEKADRLASSSSIATPSSSYPASQPGLVLSTPYNI